jgi:hypothetical protein
MADRELGFVPASCAVCVVLIRPSGLLLVALAAAVTSFAGESRAPG